MGLFGSKWWEHWCFKSLLMKLYADLWAHSWILQEQFFSNVCSEDPKKLLLRGLMSASVLKLEKNAKCCLKFYLFFIFWWFIVCAILDVLVFPFHLPPSSPPPTFIVNPNTIVHVHGSFMYVIYPFIFFQSVPTTPLCTYTCQSIPYFHVSGSISLISLFCSLEFSYKWDYIFVFYLMTYFT